MTMSSFFLFPPTYCSSVVLLITKYSDISWEVKDKINYMFAIVSPQLYSDRLVTGTGGIEELNSSVRMLGIIWIKEMYSLEFAGNIFLLLLQTYNVSIINIEKTSWKCIVLEKSSCLVNDNKNYTELSSINAGRGSTDITDA